MSNFSEELIQRVWEKAVIIPNMDEKKHRQDLAGAWIQRDKYGEKSLFGWSIDHLLPISLGGGHELINLIPLQWENNNTKSDNFPSFQTSVTNFKNTNIEKLLNWIFSKEDIDALKKVYPNNLTLLKIR